MAVHRPDRGNRLEISLVENGAAMKSKDGCILDAEECRIALQEVWSFPTAAQVRLRSSSASLMQLMKFLGQ